ncbi:MAG: sigma-54 dependent transcriptional regulator [Pirellulales bacterium]
MSHPLFLISPHTGFIDELRHLVPDGFIVEHASSAAALGEVVRDQNASQAVLAHLVTDPSDTRAAATMLDDLAAGGRVVIALVDNDCPAALRSAADGRADACLTLPIDTGELHRVLRQCLAVTPPRSTPLEEFPHSLPHRIVESATRSFITLTPSMFPMLDELEVAARHDVTVLITGETGSGKTYLARLIHELSDRRDERHCTVACGALPNDLIESELFGHTRGAFTGADRDREGKFAAAGSGTLLLDEIDVLSLHQQAKLLRVIETGEYEPVGSNETRVSEARLITASNRDLEQLVTAGQFRQDLMYRLNVVELRLPPLRERPLDVELMARRFAATHAQQHDITLREISPEFFEALGQYSWPGNLRELDNVVRRAVLYCRDGVLRAADLPSSVSPSTARERILPVTEGAAMTLEARVGAAERQVICETLARNNHHRIATAKELGISRVTLYNKMKKFGMIA